MLRGDLDTSWENAKATMGRIVVDDGQAIKLEFFEDLLGLTINSINSKKLATIRALLKVSVNL